MSDSERTATERLSARLTQLEELFTHFQQTLETLDQVMQEFGRRLDTLEADLTGLSTQVRRFEGAGPERGRLEDERPPHY